MKLCNEHCNPICFHCKSYKDYSDVTNIPDEVAVFEYEGLCKKKNKPVFADNFCIDGFECFCIK